MGTVSTDLSVKSEDAILQQPLHEEEEDIGYDPRDCYMLIYKKQGSIETRHFHFIPPEGSKRKPFAMAIERAQQFCEKMDFRFIHCAPFIISLEELERKRVEY